MGVDRFKDRITTLNLSKFSRVVFLCPFSGLYRKLLTIIKNKGKQCNDEHPKRKH